MTAKPEPSDLRAQNKALADQAINAGLVLLEQAGQKVDALQAQYIAQAEAKEKKYCQGVEKLVQEARSDSNAKRVNTLSDFRAMQDDTLQESRKILEESLKNSQTASLLSPSSFLARQAMLRSSSVARSYGVASSLGVARSVGAVEMAGGPMQALTRQISNLQEKLARDLDHQGNALTRKLDALDGALQRKLDGIKGKRDQQISSRSGALQRDTSAVNNQLRRDLAQLRAFAPGEAAEKCNLAQEKILRIHQQAEEDLSQLFLGIQRDLDAIPPAATGDIKTQVGASIDEIRRIVAAAHQQLTGLRESIRKG